MKRIVYLILPLLMLAAVMGGCKGDDPDTGNSIFVDPTGEQSSFDKWLKTNYVDPYNMRVLYRLKDVETDKKYNVIPADITKAKQICVLMRHLWLEAYTEVAADGVHMVRTVVPKLIHLIGSAEYDSDGSRRLGVAEGGMMITVSDINGMDPHDAVEDGGNYEASYFHVMHHEFAHVLHQTKPYPVEFNTISVADYLPTSWFNRSTQEALDKGFISRYGGSQIQEDFVEIISSYVTFPVVEWDKRIAAASEEGKAKIAQKLAIAKKYMNESWGVDLDELRTVVHRRGEEAKSFDFDNLGF